MHIDRAAADKAQFAQQVLHDDVVLMGVDAQVRALSKSPVQAEFTDALPCAVAGDAVDHAVGTVIQPFSICNDRIGRLYVLPPKEEESPDDPSFVGTDVAVSPVDILADQSFRRPVRRPPLVRIALLRHEAAGAGVDLHDPVKVCLRGFPDFHR